MIMIKSINQSINIRLLKAKLRRWWLYDYNNGGVGDDENGDDDEDDDEDDDNDDDDEDADDYNDDG